MQKKITERIMEDLIIEHSDDLIEPNLTLIGRQTHYGGCYFDLLFRDRFDRLLLIEIKKGVVNREAVGQIIEYYGALKQSTKEPIELMLIGNVIPIERRHALEHIGIEVKEIPESVFLCYLNNDNQPELDQDSETEFNVENAPDITIHSGVVMWRVTVKPEEDPTTAWQNCLEQGIICIGWPGRECDQEPPVRRFMRIREGDWIIAHVPNEGPAIGMGIGKVIGPYKEVQRAALPPNDPWTGDFKRQYAVDWEKVGKHSLRGILKSFRQTVVQLKTHETELIFRLYGVEND